jgi:dipeptidyl aminopeptidase/acylaminoacyl peptidase
MTVKADLPTRRGGTNRISPLRLSFVAVALFSCALQAQENPTFRMPSPALAAIVDAPSPPTVVPSPDRRELLLLDRPDVPSIVELAEPELKIAGLRINPATNGPSRSNYFTGIVFKPLDGAAERRVAGLPAGARIGDYEWSRDSRHLAFTLVAERGIELWVVDVPTAHARRLVGPILNAMLGKSFGWVDEVTLAIRRVPAQREPPPAAALVPIGPIVQENRGRRAASRTYDGLLASPHDEALFDYYGTSELALVSLQGKLTPLPVRGLITLVHPSPDGRHLLIHTLHRPYSYLVPASRFPVAIDVLDRAGRPEYRVADVPLNESAAKDSGRPGPRMVRWRNDAPATLSWFDMIAGAGGGKPGETGRVRDAWFTFAAPFTAQPVEQQRFEFSASAVQWGDDTLALVTETSDATRRVRTWQVAPGRPGSNRTLLFDRNTEDRYGDPGQPAMTRNAFGRAVLECGPHGGKLFLSGAGASPDGDRPFLDELDLATKTTRRLWRSAPPDFEEFVAFTDATLTRALVTRESVTMPANYFLRHFDTGALTPLTAFPNPYPHFADVKQEVIRYQRADGVALSGTLCLPPGWTPDQGPLPTLIWAYPRDFLNPENAEQVKATPERFARVNPTGPLPFVLAGYAVLNDPAMPIVAQGGKKPNDTYIEQLIANAEAAVGELIRRGVSEPHRIGVAGHSYGAFMTANLLAHSRLFRAGIARSGAYNRTLTPFGFQSERRHLWDAPEVYAAMSPFNFVPQIKAPLLLIHGAADNNQGTFPIQSERFYNALKGHGATARFVLLPHESHTYRARESLLHMLAEMETWLDTHVKAAKPQPKQDTE